jgi:predicted ATPase
MRTVSVRLGIIKERWAALLNSGSVISDPVQIRAVDIVDDFFRQLKDHRSSPKRIENLRKFDVSAMQHHSTGVHDEVEEYTRRLAIENRRLLALQKGTKLRESARERTKQQPTSNPPALSQQRNEESDLVVDETPKLVSGLYLFGSVGRGKTMLMNILFESLGSDGIRRYHFFDLMSLIHSQMGSKDLLTIANDIADSTNILFLDEVVITDVQDASIFPSIIEILLKRDVAIIMTSNQHPQSLYSGGLNRHVYLPPLLRELRRGVRMVSLDPLGGADFEVMDYRRLSGEKSDWSWSTEFPRVTDPSLLEIGLSPTRSLKFEKMNGIAVISHLEDFVSNLNDGDFVTIARALKLKSIPIRLCITEPFRLVDILSTGRKFGKFIEVLYDEKCMVQIESKFSVQELFSEIFRDRQNLTKLVGETSDALASSLASSNVDEAYRSLDRCISRLSGCRRV